MEKKFLKSDRPTLKNEANPDFFFGDIKYGGAHRKKQKFNQHESSESCDCSIQHGHLYAILDVGGGEMWAKNTVSNYKTGRIAGIGRKFCPRVIQEFQKMVNMLLFASKLVKMIVTAVVHTWISHSWKQYRPCKTSPTEAYCFFEETDVTTDVEPVDAFMANATTVTRILPPKKETSTDTTHDWKHQIESLKKIPTYLPYFSLACYANITIYFFWPKRWVFLGIEIFLSYFLFYIVVHSNLWVINRSNGLEKNVYHNVLLMSVWTLRVDTVTLWS